MSYLSRLQSAVHEVATKAHSAIQRAFHHGKTAAAAIGTTLTIAAGNVHAALPAEAQQVTTAVIADAKEAAGLGYSIMAVVLGLSIAFGLVKAFVRKGASS